uniref:Uncharacterized protein n=2 Tax=Natrinema zhouii TaxID=1710539 RepID=A0A7D6GX71_9EURY
MDDDLDETRGRNSKVNRLIETYGLQGLGGELERLWTADESEERQSLRELATVFNRRLVESAMEDAGVQSLDGEVENIYRLLTDERVTSADRTRTRRRLERDGVDVDALRADFVSYQAIRTYLTDYRDASYTKNAESTKSIKETIQQLRSRITEITESKLSRLAKRGELLPGDFRVIVDVRAVCENCGTQTDVITLIDDGGCDCRE